MDVKSANEVFNHRITSGSEYLWDCWDDARFLDYECEWAHGHIVFNTKNQKVYEATVTFKDSEQLDAYRWLNPDDVQAHIDESARRGIDAKIAWDNVNWIDLELWSDFVEKASAIFSGKIPDSRVQVPIDLEDSVMLRLCMEAHKRDITLNEFVTELLQEVIDRDAVRQGAVLKENIKHSKHYYDTERNR